MAVNPQELLQQIVQNYQQDRFDVALQQLLHLQRLVKNNPMVWHLYALTQRKRGELAESERGFKKALKLAPTQHEILNNYGNLLRASNRNKEAKEQFKAALEATPNFVEAHYNLGLLFLEEQDFMPALAHLQRVLKHNPKNLQARIAAAEAYRLQNQPDQALTLLQLNESQASPMFLRARGLCYFALDDIPAALADIEAALALAPSQASLHEAYSDILWLQGDANWLRSYERQLETTPNAGELRLAYAHRLVKAEQLDAATAALQPFFTNNPPYQALLLQGHIERERGDLAKADALLTKALELEPEQQDTLSELFAVKLGQGEVEESLRISKHLIELAPMHQGWWAMHATALKASNDWDAYRTLYNYDELVKAFDVSAGRGDELSEFNQELLAFLEAQHQQKQHPLQQSLRSGTQTEGHLFHQQDELVLQLKDRISGAVTEYIKGLPTDKKHPFLKRKHLDFLYTGAWSVRLNKSGFHRNHYHSEGWISGSFYVSVPKAVNQGGNGWIKFGQADLGRAYQDEPDYIVKPQSGTVVLFPSMMWHGTVPFDDEAFRVTVAFDLVPNS